MGVLRCIDGMWKRAARILPAKHAGCRTRDDLGDGILQSSIMSSTDSWITPVELLVLGAIWGSAFMFMRVAAPAFGAMPLVEVRLALGALVLLPFLWRDRQAITPSVWLRVTLIGALNSVIPFVLFAWAA